MGWAKHSLGHPENFLLFYTFEILWKCTYSLNKVKNLYSWFGIEENKEHSISKNYTHFLRCSGNNVLHVISNTILLPPNPILSHTNIEREKCWHLGNLYFYISFFSSMEENKRLIKIIYFISPSEHYILLMISTFKMSQLLQDMFFPLLNLSPISPLPGFYQEVTSVPFDS